MALVTISPVKIDLGVIPQDQIVDFAFEVTNNSDKEFEFLPWASCGCTLPTISPAKVGPGEKAELKASFNPQGKRGLQEKGVGVNYFVSGDQRSAGATFVAIVK